MPPVVILVLAMLLGCARPPHALRGEFPPVTVPEAQLGEVAAGTRVRWGGTLVSTTPEAERTCFELVREPLDRVARPLDRDESDGRFIACARGFYDPAIFAPEREVTVIGTLAEASDGKVGDLDYRFPRVDAETVYLWPKRVAVDRVYYYPYGPGPYLGFGFGYPYWGGWGWGWPYYWGRPGFWGRPGPVVRHGRDR